MLTIKTTITILLLATTTFAKADVIPKPNKITELPGSLNVKSVRVQYKTGGGHVDEGYKLRISKTGIIIESTSASGKFYAQQTLKQLMMLSEDGTIPCLEIEDAPRYKWRGFMLDESRHFFGKEKVKQILNQMALYKLNRFHWHLTDNQGWRIEIKKYPKLTSVGSKGNHTDKNAPAKFYTQEEIKEIVQYASERFIEIIPEIDMPGHAASAVRSYRDIAGGNASFNPGSEKTYAFLTDVLTEVSEIFPSKWIHYGGDEVRFSSSRWLKLPAVKELMETKQLESVKDVEHYFNQRMADVIGNLNRTTVGWDEIVDAGLDHKKTLVMWWRHDKKHILKKAFEKNFDVVLCPRIPCYFDFVQDDSHKVGRRWKGFSSLDLTYAFPAGLDLVDSQVMGIQANLWTETVVTEKRLDFMIFPRLLALSEAAWTEGQNKNYEQFLDRLKLHIPQMEREGIYCFNPFQKNENPEPVK